MGLENRDYYRDDFSESDATVRRFRKGSPSVLVVLIAITVAVFVLQILTVRPGGSSLVQSWLALSADTAFFRGQIWRFLTYAFCHSQSDLLHLVFNMVVLYSIGQMVRDLLKDREFLWFYLTAAVFAGITSLTFYSLIRLPVVIVGASGAVYGVFALAALHYPRRSVLVMGVVPVELRWLLAIFVGIDSLPILTGTVASSKTAGAAHLGGILFAFLYFRWHMRLTSWWDQFAGRMAVRRKARGKLKLFNPPNQPEINLTEQVDRILEKISREGEASLTSHERKILTQASRQLRKERP